MKRKKKRKIPSRALLQELTALESTAATRGIHVHYDRLEAAGLRLNGGLCEFNGEHHLYIEKRKSVADKIEFLKTHLEKTLSMPEDEIPYLIHNNLRPQTQRLKG